METGWIAVRWDEMVSTLSAHNGVVVQWAELQPPASAAVRDAVARILGQRDVEIEAYLAFANGLRLRWHPADNPKKIGGDLNIPPLELCGDNHQWECAMDVFDEPSDAFGLPFPIVRGRVFPFDFWTWDDSTTEVSILIPKPDGTIDVAMSDDNCAGVDSSMLLSFGEYLDLVLRTFAAPDLRSALSVRYGNDEAIRVRHQHPGLFQRVFPLRTLLDYYAAPVHNNETQHAFFLG